MGHSVSLHSMTRNMKTPFSLKIIPAGWILSILVIAILTPNVLVISSCANMIPPSGGPRDSLPPTLTSVTPPDSSKGFTARTITFTFDEYVELQEAQKNILVSPTPEVNPSVESRLRTVTVKWEDSLEANTTYSINFGNAIRDINEGNALKNFTYIFSTGDYFDSSEFRGNVILAETGGIDSTLFVLLHRTGEDSALVNKKPRYMARVNKQGEFLFHHIAPGTYYAYALKDDNGMGKYFSTEQLFAFADSPVVVSDSTRSLTLYAYAIKRPPETASYTAAPSPGRNNELARLRFTTSVSSGVQDLLTPFSLQFSVPLKDFNPALVKVSTDTSYAPVTGYNWELDTLRQKATLATTLREDTRYNIVLEKEFGTDSLGQQLLKTDTLSFRTRRQSEYGSLRIRLKNVDSLQRPVILISQNGRILSSVSLAKGEYFTPLFLPGTYELALLYDRNNNGQWDPGEFFGKRIQPEIVKPLKAKLIVRPSWDNELDLE